MRTRLLILAVIAIPTGIIAVRLNARPYPYLRFAIEYTEASQHIPYWNSEFLQQRQAAYDAWYYDSHDLLRPHDMISQYINFKDGYRVTVGQPNASRALWLFGNSTLVGFEVRDSDTIASILQTMTNYRVVNVGILHGTMTQIELRMEREAIRSGDIVVVLAGGLDADPDAYHKALSKARGLAIQRNATFYAFLQPLRVYGPDTPYLRSMMNLLYPETMIQDMRDGYARLRGDSVDLTMLLANSPDEMFFDVDHLTPDGCAAVARAIYSTTTRMGA